MAGGQDHSGRIARLAELHRHLEPVDARKLNVKQDKLRSQLFRLPNSRLAVSGLAHNLDSIRLKQDTGDLPEPLVVVDDQDGQWHQTSLAPSTRARIRANP